MIPDSKKNASLIFFLAVQFLSYVNAFSQSAPVALKPAIQIERLHTIQNGVVRMVQDPITRNLMYSTTDGNIYIVFQDSTGIFYDSLVFASSEHNVQYLQGMAIHDSILFVSGNNDSNTPLTRGLIMRGKLQSTGIRIWDTLMITEPYETSDYFDHLFSGMAVSPNGDSIFICSGARGDHGEIQDRYGLYPGLRNLPLTTNLYAMPTNEIDPIQLLNDSIWHDTSQYVYARGIRNTFSMAFDANGNLFGVENSGDRDHNEEMNWLRRGKHYGFPWKMGDTHNPQQYPSFDPSNDLLIPHYSRSWRLGFWDNDPAFPAPDSGLIFENPIQNIGPDCDKFRDSVTGEIKDASDMGVSIGSFTAHRSPLGLVFDVNQVLHPSYRGDAFMLSWTQGYDSCGCTSVPDTAIGPFVDPSEDLVHLDLSYDSIIDNFQLSATRIVGSFQHPIDAVIDSNVIYIIENGYGGTSGLYKISLPVEESCPMQILTEYSDSCYMSPAQVVVIPSGNPPYSIYCYDSGGTLLQQASAIYDPDTLSGLQSGNYYLILNDSASCMDSLSFEILQEPALTLLGVNGTTCIGCDDGSVRFSASGGLTPYFFSVTPSTGIFTDSTLINLPAGIYVICISDSNGCMDCDTAEVLEDPTGIAGLTSHLSRVKLFPNPASEYISIQIEQIVNPGIRVEIMDMEGRVHISLNQGESEFSDPEIRLDISLLPAGYFIVEILHDGQSDKIPLIISRK